MQEIFVFNNLSKEKEKLEPQEYPKLNIYTCGPTVYDHSHIGHARSAITWDVIVRFLRLVGYDVKWTRNITDIDDKIIKRADEHKTDPDKIARIYTHSFHDDMIKLNVDWPDYEPMATQHLSNMFSFIQGLINKKHAYTVDNDVYFSVSSFSTYGKLKGQSIEELEKGFGRIEPNEKKKHHLDFALWKGIKHEKEYCFDSPWGKGRPGWHLECSAMNYALYNTKLDIHGGGDDLIFPHHENEIAQSEALTGKTFSKYWMHNGMIMVNGKKMSKSEGNFVTIKDSLEQVNGNAIRLFVLNTHYRMPLNYTQEGILAAQNAINRIKSAMEDGIETDKNIDSYSLEFIEAMSDDFNTSKALAVIFGLVEDINKEKNSAIKSDLQSTLVKITNTLGFNFKGSEMDSNASDKSLKSLVENLLNWRTSTKAEKDYKSADKIRELLTQSNIEIRDLPNNKHKWSIKN